MATLQLRNLRKSYGPVEVIKGPLTGLPST